VAPMSPVALERIGEGEARSQLRRNSDAGGAHRRRELTTAVASKSVNSSGGTRPEGHRSGGGLPHIKFGAEAVW
jgi:hypothetical protein